MGVVPRVATARESNAAAARRGLWDALDTTHCGRPDVVREFLELLSPDQRIVDVGCWNGAIAALAAARIGGGLARAEAATSVPWRSYIGVDQVPEAVAQFQRAHGSRPRTGAVVGDVRALPLGDDSADVVLCLFVLQDLEGHRADGVRALTELARVARPGAHLLVGLTVHSTREEETFYVVKELRRKGIPEKPTHHWRRADFVAAVHAAGFRITSINAFGPNEQGFVELYLRVIGPAPPRGTRAGRSTGTAPIHLLPGAPKLFVDYVHDFSRVSDLFAYDFRDGDALRHAARTAAERDLPRGELAEVLLAQNRVFGSGDRSLEKVDLLGDSESVAVVTGQQPALFGGPLYNLYKAATTVRLAQQLEEQSGRPCVPVFWIANDDHDLAKVDHIHMFDPSGHLARISWSHGKPRRIQPIAGLTLDATVDEAHDRLAETARGYSHGQEVIDLLSDFFRAGERLSDAFARLMAKLFEHEGLVLVDPSDPRLRRLGMCKLRDELAFPSPTTEAARTATEELARRGYPVQVPLRDDRLNLFFGRSERFRLRCGPSGFQVDNRTGNVDAAELRSRFDESLEQFSPNVLLRPLYQDALFPTAAYVAGPSEIAYFAQLKPVYARFEMPMPVVYPRKSITLLNGTAHSMLEGNGLRVEDVWGEAATLGSPPLDGESPDGRQEQQRWLSSCLLPEGEPQERTLGIVQGLLEAGPKLIQLVLSALDLGQFDHQVVLANPEDAAPIRVEAGSV